MNPANPLSPLNWANLDHGANITIGPVDPMGVVLGFAAAVAVIVSLWWLAGKDKPWPG